VITPYTIIDADGTELLVLGHTHTVVADLDGDRLVWSEHDHYADARIEHRMLAKQGVQVDIEIDHWTVDLADFWRETLASPLDHLAVDWHEGGTA
jgi:hypothetical protein